MIPKYMFLTKGVGSHKEQLASFELALRNAGIHRCNIVTVSSIIPSGCKLISKEEGLKKLLEWIEKEKKIGVIIDCNLICEEHINTKVTTANRVMHLIRRSYTFLNEDVFLPLYKALVRSHLDYANSVWYPRKNKHVNILHFWYSARFLPISMLAWCLLNSINIGRLMSAFSPVFFYLFFPWVVLICYY